MEIVSLIENDESEDLSKWLEPVLAEIRNRFLNHYTLKHSRELLQYISILRLFTHRYSLAKVHNAFNRNPVNIVLKCRNLSTSYFTNVKSKHEERLIFDLLFVRVFPS